MWIQYSLVVIQILVKDICHL